MKAGVMKLTGVSVHASSLGVPGSAGAPRWHCAPGPSSAHRQSAPQAQACAPAPP